MTDADKMAASGLPKPAEQDTVEIAGVRYVCGFRLPSETDAEAGWKHKLKRRRRMRK